MELITKPLSRIQIAKFRKKYGDYLKLTVDIEKENLVLGEELHADGEKILLENDSQQTNIWGGGINLKDKIIDTTAVLNLRPNLNNDSMEILDSERRVKFIRIVKKYFAELWN